VKFVLEKSENIGLIAIASYVPPGRKNNVEQCISASLSTNTLLEKIGVESLPRAIDLELTSDMACSAISQLLSTSTLTIDEIECLVVVTQNPDEGGIPHVSSIVHKKLELDYSVAAFDISLGCSGYVYGLSVVKGFMEQAGFANGILVTADPYSKILRTDDHTTNLLFGDAATATWLGYNPQFDIWKPQFYTNGAKGSAIEVKLDEGLYMNGRSVFEFARRAVPDQINSFIASLPFEPDDLDAICLHQGSRAILNEIRVKLTAYKARVFDDMSFAGNTVSSSIPLVLERHILNDEGLKKVVLCGFGVGLSIATGLLIRRETRYVR
jgi:3-oxoacyl-[acyl-carrier-protein] synthase-3